MYKWYLFDVLPEQLKINDDHNYFVNGLKT